MSEQRWSLTREEQAGYIAALTNELIPLRLRAEISQGDLAYIVGVSRQTYSAIELKKKVMSWNTYLSLIFFFDSNVSTHTELHEKGLYPEKMVSRFNEGKRGSLGTTPEEIKKINNIVAQLDDQARHTLKTTLMVEYARCKKLPGYAVIKAFDGADYNESFLNEEQLKSTDSAINNLKRHD